VIRAGGFDVVPLRDAEGSFATFREAFGVDSDEQWVLPFHAYLVRDGTMTAVVDTGVGPPPSDFLDEPQGWLPDELAAAGVAPDAVDLIVLTHLHVDHVGWNSLFPRARIVANRRDHEFFLETRGERQYVKEQIAALDIELIDGELEVAPGIRMLPAYGHTPGHMTVELAGGEAQLLGDVAVHELQLKDTDVAYTGEIDAPEAAARRAELLPPLADAGTVVGLSHLASGLGRIGRVGDAFTWEPL
jgi:glyoxylase-like metal-dependent hydrolase (beta-lactamase superfamily II)